MEHPEERSFLGVYVKFSAITVKIQEFDVLNRCQFFGEVMKCILPEICQRCFYLAKCWLCQCFIGIICTAIPT